MGFFNELGKKTTETTSKIAREAKLKMKISENKGKIKELYESIGKNIYENHVKEIEDCEQRVEEDCKKIDELSTAIEEARKEILVLNNKKLCPKCFAEIEIDAVFCSKCGEKQQEEKTVFEKAEEEIKVVEVLPKNEEKKEAVEEELKEKNSDEE